MVDFFFKRIDLVFLVFNKLIVNTMFFVCSAFVILKLDTLIICTGPLYVWIVITAIFGLICCYDYKAKLIFFY